MTPVEVERNTLTGILIFRCMLTLRILRNHLNSLQTINLISIKDVKSTKSHLCNCNMTNKSCYEYFLPLLQVFS